MAGSNDNDKNKSPENLRYEFLIKQEEMTWARIISNLEKLYSKIDNIIEKIHELELQHAHHETEHKKLDLLYTGLRKEFESLKEDLANIKTTFRADVQKEVQDLKELSDKTLDSWISSEVLVRSFKWAIGIAAVVIAMNFMSVVEFMKGLF